MRNLTVLCDEYGGRFAGTPENQSAAEYLLGKFEEYMRRRKAAVSKAN